MGPFSSGLSLCDDFRKEMSFLLPCISGLIKAQHSQGDDKSPLFVSMVFRLVVLFIINNSQSRSWTCWARHIKSVNGFVFFRLSYLDYSDLQLFAIFIFEVDFSVTYFMTSAENSVWEPPNPLGEDTPRPPYKVMVILAPRNKKPTITDKSIWEGCTT